MTTGRIRDFVRAYLKEYGVSKAGSLPKTMIDELINVEMQNHFAEIKSLYGYFHTPVTEDLDEYTLPTYLQSAAVVKVANERYYPARWPYVDDAKRLGDGRTRVTTDGYTVDAVGDRWYWIKGDVVQIYPAPEESTGTSVTGTCDVASSVATISTGSLSSDNYYRKRLININGSYYVILSHDSADIYVDGSPPDASSVTYTIYDHGLEIEGVRVPTDLTIGGDDDVPGSDIDGMSIALKVAYMLGLTLPGNKANMRSLLDLYNNYFKRAKNNTYNKQRQGPLTISPFTFRTDMAGNK